MNVIAHTATLAPDGSVRPVADRHRICRPRHAPGDDIRRRGPDGPGLRPGGGGSSASLVAAVVPPHAVGAGLAHRTARRDDTRRDRGGWS